MKLQIVILEGGFTGVTIEQDSRRGGSVEK